MRSGRYDIARLDCLCGLGVDPAVLVWLFRARPAKGGCFFLSFVDCLLLGRVAEVAVSGSRFWGGWFWLLCGGYFLLALLGCVDSGSGLNLPKRRFG